MIYLWMQCYLYTWGYINSLSEQRNRESNWQAFALQMGVRELEEWRWIIMESKANVKNERVYRRILVPLDGSEAAEVVLNLAKNLTVRSGTALTLLHVCTPEQHQWERLHLGYIEHIAEQTQRDISKICETVQCHFEGVTATVVSMLVKGEPAKEIVRYAEESEASIILMATHGRSGLRQSVMSDIANRVVRTSPVPVWLLRTLGPHEIVCAEWPPERILVPLDGSQRAEKVLPYAVEYAKLFDAELVILRICEEPIIPSDYPKPDWDEHVDRTRSHYQAQCSLYLAEVEQRIKEPGLKVIKECWLGNAAEEIVGYIRENRCDLVAMTAYGRSAVPRWLTDSPGARWVFSNVTEQVLIATSRGILLVRP
jgi:nucleotide-binding universal stress UspA family protein